jgi:outer membrane protein assembly factor BamD
MFSALCRFGFAWWIMALAAVLPVRLAADLVWSPQTGWRVEGGAISGLIGEEGRNALDLMNRARAAEEAGNRRSAIKTYGRVAKKYPNSLYAPEALYRSGRLQLERKKYKKAFDDFQSAVGRYPNTPRFNEIIGQQYAIASALLNGARGRFLWVFPGFTNREKAVEQFELILLNAPYSDYAPLAMMNIARGHQRLGNVEEAIDALDRLINAYGQSLLAPDAYLKLAETHASLVEGANYDQEATRNAITYFEDFMILFPSDGNVAKAEKGLGDMKEVLAESKIRMGDFYFYKRDNYKAARVLYNEAITVYPDSAAAGRARTKLAEVAAAEAKGAAKRKRFFFF